MKIINFNNSSGDSSFFDVFTRKLYMHRKIAVANIKFELKISQSERVTQRKPGHFD